MSTVDAYEAKTRLSELLDRAENGERIIITRNGHPSAVLQFVRAQRTQNVREVIESLVSFRKGRRLESGELRSMIDEGRL